MKRIVITRPQAQADEFAAALTAAGMQPVFFPVIEIHPPADIAPLDEALQSLARFRWLALTSVNGVQAVWERMAALGIKGLPEGLRVAAIGPKTAAALRKHGVTPDFVPGEYVAEAILPGLGDVRGREILLPRAELARETLAEAIREAGGVAHEVTAYRTLPARPRPEAMESIRRGVDAVTLTSASTARNFVALVRSAGLDPLRLPGAPIYACIGPVTAAAARDEGLPVNVVAAEYTTEGLIKALIDGLGMKSREKEG